MYKRVLLKLSGEALSNGKDNPFYEEHLQNVALEVKNAVDAGVQVAIVVGGGNLYRGKIGVNLGMDRATGDYMGMLATVMNALAISNALTKNEVKNVVMTSIEMKGLAEHFTASSAIKALEEGKVVIDKINYDKLTINNISIDNNEMKIDMILNLQKIVSNT